ncbi:hypothetical protein N0V85_005498 [Neurospora sp. IMI 360204]|nr:hypothetical protein N0V85_005498 [Neurospora sp. IMI 360204]
MQILNGTRQQRTWVTRAPPSDMDLSSSEDSDSEFAAYIRKIKEGTTDPQTVTESNELCRCIDDTITSLLRIAMQVDDSLLNSKFDLCQLKDSDFIEPDIMHAGPMLNEGNGSRVDDKNAKALYVSPTWT